METLLKLKTDELNDRIIDFLKHAYKGKNIVLHVYEDDNSIDTSGDWADKIKGEHEWFKQEGAAAGNEHGFSVESLQEGLVNNY